MFFGIAHLNQFAWMDLCLFNSLCSLQRWPLCAKEPQATPTGTPPRWSQKMPTGRVAFAMVGEATSLSKPISRVAVTANPFVAYTSISSRYWAAITLILLSQLAALPKLQKLAEQF